ncbi:TonB-dependent receptor [Sphingobacterium gobiense]|uniref:TonB-dependent receptor n=1 Tax=Sphingobacterium gobiense TaxID=1382456 RepID=A0A2S9JTT3_9SPHI|nr:TonB-dependent receptor [Sphingobacterium gobiense]PRD56679.1 hypothetical protein C5749_05465 [Sphingobacterium gobiense]
MTKIYTILITCLLTHYGYSQSRLTGRLIDEAQKPVVYATVLYINANETTLSSKDGAFTFTLLPHQDSVRLRINFIGKQTKYISYPASNIPTSPVIQLNDQSLTLEEVSVLPTYSQDGRSNSSITIDRQAIDQLQAFSLVDVMNSLPGKKMQPLDMNTLSMFNFRGGFSMKNGAPATDGTNVQQLNNSLGIAIIIDDMRVSNDANMQAQGFARGGFNSSKISGGSFRDSYFGNRGRNTYDTPFQGIDLRDIPTTNIERIEVIQGIAPARYGEVTDGAVIIDRQAGKSPYVVSFNINGGSTGSSVSKGFQLPGNWGAINFSTNWTHSNADPKDKVKSFNRYGQSIIWTRSFDRFKNTLSLDYSGRNDRKRQDPDDETLRTSQFSNNRFGLSNRLRYELESKWVKSIQLNANISGGKQESYSSYAMNKGPIYPVANLDTIGVYEGVFVDGRYVAEEIIIGKPLNGSLALSANSSLPWGTVTHNVQYGVNYTISNNGGQGILSDPERPRFSGTNNQNLRPYSYESLPTAQNIGLYVEDNFQVKLGERTLSNNIGVRYDIQNGYGTLQPRINSRLRWNEQWGFTAGFGLGSKAPTLAHLYPGPVYIDYDLALATTGTLDSSFYLLFTDRFTPDNSKLKPSKSLQLELGVEHRNSFFTSSIYTYYKRNWDGFAQQRQLRRYVLPEYNFWFDQETGKYAYAASGDEIIMGGLLDFNMINGASSETWGFDWFISTPRLPYINTSISLNTSLTYNVFKDVVNEPVEPAQRIEFEDKSHIKTVFYTPRDHNNTMLMSKLNTVTHLSRIGFVLNFSADINWMATQNITNSLYPIAYLDSKINYMELSELDALQSPFNQLIRTSSDQSRTKQPMAYVTMNLGVEKEIRKNFRINLRGYNIFDIRPYKVVQYDNGTELVFNPNSKPSLTIGTTIKF